MMNFFDAYEKYVKKPKKDVTAKEIVELDAEDIELDTEDIESAEQNDFEPKEGGDEYVSLTLYNELLERIKKFESKESED